MFYYVCQYKLKGSDNWKTKTFEHKSYTIEDLERDLKNKFGDRVTDFKIEHERPIKVETPAETTKSNKTVGQAGIEAMRAKLK